MYVPDIGEGIAVAQVADPCDLLFSAPHDGNWMRRCRHQLDWMAAPIQWGPEPFQHGAKDKEYVQDTQKAASGLVALCQLTQLDGLT